MDKIMNKDCDLVPNLKGMLMLQAYPKEETINPGGFWGTRVPNIIPTMKGWGVGQAVM